jgi:hypothetical protein
MGDKELAEYIKKHKKFPRDFYDYLNYSILIFPLFFVFMGFAAFIYRTEPFDTLMSVLLIFLGIALSIFFFKRLNATRSFHQISLNPELTLDTISESIKRNFKLIRMSVNPELNMIKAVESMTFFSYGSEITLFFFDNNEALVNVRTAPVFQPFTLFRDKRKFQKLISLIK